MSEQEPRDGMEAAMLELAQRMSSAEHIAWTDAFRRIASGTPMAEAVFDALRALGCSTKEARKRIKAVQASTRNWRESLT